MQKMMRTLPMEYDGRENAEMAGQLANPPLSMRTGTPHRQGHELTT